MSSEKKDKYNCYLTEDYLDMAPVCSSNDCTGMVARGTADEGELDDYKEMYNFGEIELKRTAKKKTKK